VRRLLDRGFLLSQAIERWQSRAIWVVSRADAAYPRRLKIRLKELAPPVFYGCGDVAILGTGGLAVVGLRHVDSTLVEYTEEVGRLAATARQTVVSGGAKGIDQAAMRGALSRSGKVVGVLADSLEKAAMNREHRKMLLERWLVLVSPYDPSAPFNVGHAMQRNKLIYALADAALVVNSDIDKGGTWAGATEAPKTAGSLVTPVLRPCAAAAPARRTASHASCRRARCRSQRGPWSRLADRRSHVVTQPRRSRAPQREHPGLVERVGTARREHHQQGN
jgi:predicted Rossmann fold nucleotide-binding protein DprA/Smf involved in DNA uptake